MIVPSILVTVIIFSLVGSAFITNIITNVVSAFQLPQQQHLVAGSNQIQQSHFSVRIDSFLSVSKTTESASSFATETALTSSHGDTTKGDDDNNRLTIVPPNAGFRNTKSSGGTEVSITSMNLLAPFYNSLQLPSKTTSDYERWKFLDEDRTQRVPEAIRMAKQTNADVLCLQEIEGGKLGEAGASQGKEFTLRDDVREWLAESTTAVISGEIVTIEGYDSFVWSPLNPNNKRGDVVGLCIAWRSRKHSLVNWEGYRRGMVCQLKEASDDDDEVTASFAIANLHLPARPSNVLGRLKTMSKTISKLSDLDRAMKQERPKMTAGLNSIHGLLVVAGDFNSDQDSVAARLLSHGHTNYGNVRDRNYKAKVTKASASNMSHPYRFIDSYDHGVDYGSTKNDLRFKDSSFRDIYASVTVSLKGRGPGIMDHLFYATGTKGGKPLHQLRKKPIATTRKNPSQAAMKAAAISTTEALSNSILQEHLGKRSKRRKKGETRGGGGNLETASAAHYSNNQKNAKIKVEAVLATLESPSSGGASKRLEIINEGLPNREEGFPSDHLPVGVLFSAINDKTIDTASSTLLSKVSDDSSVTAKQISESTDLPREELCVEENSSSTKSITSIVGQTNNETKAALSSTNKIASSASKHRSGSSGISSAVQRRRRSSKTSFGLRRRHNVVLNAMADWLVGKGATSVVLDKPLYKNDLLARTLGQKEVKTQLTKKSRAPDLMCVVVNASGEECLVVVEVAVASDPDKVRAKKTSKYQDLIDVLSRFNKTCRLATIVVQDDGAIPEGTSSDIRWLAQWMSGNIESPEEIEDETNRLCALLESRVSTFQI